MKINNFIDYTLLKPHATSDEIIKLCEDAIEYKFVAVCVNSHYLPLINKLLENSTIKKCVVHNFPLGVNLTEMKLSELKIALNNGAQEVDTVINLAKLLEGEVNYVTDELALLAESCHSFRSCLKVILETCYLTEEQIF